MSQPKEKKHVLRFLYISRAHPHCRIRRLVYIKLPEEDPRSADPTLCGRLNIALYGTRDAGQSFEFEVREVVTGAGCEQGISSPCVYGVKERELYFFHHGDDFVVGGPEEESQWLVKVLEKKFIRGILGGGEGHVKHIACLNRMLRWNGIYAEGGEAIEYEADSRHAEVLRKQMGLSDESRGLSSQGVQVKLTPEVEMQLDEDRAASFRSACMRLSYLALDRPEMQFTAKECARGMSNPTERH